jgi:ADP-ribose pyrophosphatase YjhB (NUDIX family)
LIHPIWGTQPRTATIFPVDPVQQTAKHAAMTASIIPAASVAILKAGRFLLVKRGHPPAEGLFAFPGGKLEPGETPEQAARRELFEETGLKAGDLRLWKVIDLGGSGRGIAYGMTSTPNPSPQGGGERCGTSPEHQIPAIPARKTMPAPPSPLRGGIKGGGKQPRRSRTTSICDGPGGSGENDQPIYRLHVFLGHSVEGEPAAADDAASLGWFSLAEMERLAITRSTLEAARAMALGHDDA